jgi:structural maintenance of chromosome 2
MKLLDNEILPKLENLREAKRVWMEFQQVETELEHIKHILIAYDYAHHAKKVETCDAERNRMAEQLENLERMKLMLTDELKELEEDYNNAMSERQKVIRF